MVDCEPHLLRSFSRIHDFLWKDLESFDTLLRRHHGDIADVIKTPNAANDILSAISRSTMTMP